jgi:flagellar protein FliO/FliZ
VLKRWLWLAMPSLALAEAKPTAAPAQGPGVGDLLQMALSLVLVIGFILGLTWVLGRLRGAAHHSSGSLRVLAEVAVGPKERVVLVKVGEGQALVGVGASGVVSLDLLAKPANVDAIETTGTFADKLKSLMTRTEIKP